MAASAPLYDPSEEEKQFAGPTGPPPAYQHLYPEPQAVATRGEKEQPNYSKPPVPPQNYVPQSNHPAQGLVHSPMTPTVQHTTIVVNSANCPRCRVGTLVQESNACCFCCCALMVCLTFPFGLLLLCCFPKDKYYRETSFNYAYFLVLADQSAGFYFKSFIKLSDKYSSMMAFILHSLTFVMVVEGATAGAALAMLITFGVAAENLSSTQGTVPDHLICILTYLSICVLGMIVGCTYLALAVQKRSAKLIGVYIAWRLFFSLLSIALCIYLCVHIANHQNLHIDKLWPQCVIPLILEATIGFVFAGLACVAFMIFRKHKIQAQQKPVNLQTYYHHPKDVDLIY